VPAELANLMRENLQMNFLGELKGSYKEHRDRVRDRNPTWVVHSKFKMYAYNFDNLHEDLRKTSAFEDATQITLSRIRSERALYRC